MAMNYTSLTNPAQPKPQPMASMTHITYHPPQPKAPSQPSGGGYRTTQPVGMPGQAYAGGTPNFNETTGAYKTSPVMGGQLPPQLLAMLMQKMSGYQPPAGGGGYADFLRAFLARLGGAQQGGGTGRY